MGAPVERVVEKKSGKAAEVLEVRGTVFDSQVLLLRFSDGREKWVLRSDVRRVGNA